MTEKRFTYSSEKEGYCLDDEYFCEMEDTEEITMLLNAQQETITQLRHQRQEDINELAVIAIKYKALEEENKALKDIKNICKKYNIKLEDVAETLEEYICLDNGEEL